MHCENAVHKMIFCHNFPLQFFVLSKKKITKGKCKFFLFAPLVKRARVSFVLMTPGFVCCTHFLRNISWRTYAHWSVANGGLFWVQTWQWNSRGKCRTFSSSYGENREVQFWIQGRRKRRASQKGKIFPNFFLSSSAFGNVFWNKKGLSVDVTYYGEARIPNERTLALNSDCGICLSRISISHQRNE